MIIGNFAASPSRLRPSPPNSRFAAILLAMALANCSSGSTRSGADARASLDAVSEAEDAGSPGPGDALPISVDANSELADAPSGSGDVESAGDAVALDAAALDSTPIDALAGALDAQPPADAGPACSTPVAPDPLLADRQACRFSAGSTAAATLGLSDADRAALPFQHLVVIMKENRSFDHLFGDLAATQPEAEVFPAGFSNLDSDGNAVPPFHLETTCVFADPGHGWAAMHEQVNGGLMDGYARSAASTTDTDGHFALGYYVESDLPFYYFLATTYALSDHYFPSVRSATFPNRDYLLLATSDGVTETQYTTWPSPALPSIFDRLDAAGVSWGVYADDHPLEETLNDPMHDWEMLHPWSPVSDLISAFARDDVPSVVFVDGRENVEDEHPLADVQVGEAWTKAIYDAALASPAWGSTVLLLTYDEAGGFFDHVPPPDSCPARPADAAFYELGTRVPLIAISPWARRHHVSKTVREHTSIIRFIEAVFGLPALTARDANSDALLDLFDFSCPPAAVPAAPLAGTGGCQAGVLTLDQATYTSGQPINATFAHGPGATLDWIGVYPSGVQPQSGSSIWVYLGGGHTAPTHGLVQGTVTLGPGSDGNTPWPLPAGSWTAYYLLDDGYSPIASASFTVQ
jgi:phospholipase C